MVFRIHRPGVTALRSCGKQNGEVSVKGIVLAAVIVCTAAGLGATFAGAASVPVRAPRGVAGGRPQTRPFTAPPRRVASAQSQASSGIERESSQELYDSVTEILKRYGGQPAACRSELLELWTAHKGSESRSIAAACSLVDEQDVPEFLRRVDGLLTTRNADALICGFFCEGAPILCEHMRDPESVLKAAVRYKCWEAIPRYKCNEAIKQRYLLEGVAECDSIRCCGMTSLTPYITQSGIQPLRRIVHSLREKPSWSGFSIAARTLCDFDDVSIVVDVEFGLSKEGTPASMRNELEFVALRLKAQNDPKRLLQVVASESRNDVALYWALHRAIRVGVSPYDVEKALSNNASPGARLFETRLDAAINGRRYAGSEIDVCPESLSGRELREYRRIRAGLPATLPAKDHQVNTLSDLVAAAISRK